MVWYGPKWSGRVPKWSGRVPKWSGRVPNSPSSLVGSPNGDQLVTTWCRVVSSKPVFIHCIAAPLGRDTAAAKY